MLRGARRLLSFTHFSNSFCDLLAALSLPFTHISTGRAGLWARWLAGCLAGWLAGWPAGWLAGWWAGWLAG